MSILAEVSVDVSKSILRNPPYIAHQVLIERADSILNVEFSPFDLQDNFVLLVRFNAIPTYKNYTQGILVWQDSEVVNWNSEGGRNKYLRYCNFLVELHLFV